MCVYLMSLENTIQYIANSQLLNIKGTKLAAFKVVHINRSLKTIKGGLFLFKFNVPVKF